MKKEIFSKINRKDFNNELEEILEKKDFSKDVKNLLLSMLYKIEMSYEDYTTVKRNVKNKADFIQDILKKIECCEHIIFIKPQSEESAKLKERNIDYIIEKKEKTVKAYPNEKSLLFAINKFGDPEIYLSEKYNYLRIAIPELINEGNDNDNVEIIRDFNAWSWNVSINEISDINYNLIYQMLQILLGQKKLEEIFLKDQSIDSLDYFEKELEKKFGNKISTGLLKNVYKLSILLCIKNNTNERKRLIEEKELIEKDLNTMEDKETYLNNLSKQKKKMNNEIKKVDQILNNKEKLKIEFSKRNNKSTDENQIFSLSHLSDILEKERRRYLNTIQEINKSIEPLYYVDRKQKLKRDLELLKDINFDLDQEDIISKEFMQFQKKFLKCFEKLIEIAEEKKEIIELIYLFRYYLLLPYNNNYVKDLNSLNKLFNDVRLKLINKMYELKVINKITHDDELNIKILKFIFQTKMIVLENMVIELKEQDKNIQIDIMDIDVLEDSHTISIKDLSKYKLKYNKKIKVFN